MYQQKSQASLEEIQILQIMNKNEQEWPKMTKNEQIWIKMNKHEQIWIKMNKNEQKWRKMNNIQHKATTRTKAIEWTEEIS